MIVNRRQSFAIITLLLVLAFSSNGLASGPSPDNTPNTAKPTVLVFGLGPRCNYCVQLKQNIGEVKRSTGESVLFKDFLVDKDTDMVQKWRVILSPTLIFLNATGKESFRHQGMMTSSDILNKLESLGFIKIVK